MYNILLNNKLGTYPDYQTFKFPGGELHLKLSRNLLPKLVKEEALLIKCRLLSSDDIILLILLVNTINDKYPKLGINVLIGYMAYGQADDKFSQEESFSLKYIAAVLNMLPVQAYYVYDPHSLAIGASLKNCKAIDNRDFVSTVLMNIYLKEVGEKIPFGRFIKSQMCILSPDAGAYKKIFKLVENINFSGQVETANKYREQIDGGLKVRFSCEDFKGKDVLIVDDICAGGNTFLGLGELLKARNCGNLFLAVSHGVFGNMQQVPQETIIANLLKIFKMIFVTNSRGDSFPNENIFVYKIL